MEIVIGISQSYAVIRNTKPAYTATLLRLSQIFDVIFTSLLESQAAYLVTNFLPDRKNKSLIIYAQKGIRIVFVTANNLFRGFYIEHRTNNAVGKPCGKLMQPDQYRQYRQPNSNRQSRRGSTKPNEQERQL